MPTSTEPGGAAGSDGKGGRLTFSQKWGDDPFTQMGHTQVPNALVEYAARLDLRSEECWLICCILRFKYSVADPHPNQETLARLFGQSVDTVQRTIKKIVTKKLLKVERARGEGGAFTHTVYDFTPLRFALNECYYQDHPQERPQAPVLPTPRAPKPTPQNCGLGDTDHTAVLRPGAPHEPHRSSAARPTPQFCGPKKRAASGEETEEDSSSRANAPAPAGVGAPAAAADDLEIKALAAEMIAHGVNRADALRLAAASPGECRRQLAFLPFVAEFRKGKGAYLRSAVEQGFGPPSGWTEAQKRRAEEERRAVAAARGADRAARDRRAANERAAAVRALREELEAGEPARWAELVAEAEVGMAPPVRSRPHSAAYAAAVNAAVARLLPAGGVP